MNKNRGKQDGGTTPPPGQFGGSHKNTKDNRVDTGINSKVIRIEGGGIQR